MEQALIYVVPALGLVGLLAMAVKSAWVNKQATGDANMVELFAIIDGTLLARSRTLVDTSSLVIAVAFVIGALFCHFVG